MKLKIATGKSVYKSKIKQQTITVDKLYNMLAIPTIQKSKDGAYFILASFKSEKRTAASVDQYYGAALDLDDVELSIEEIQETFKRYSNCIYTTFNHKAAGKGKRFRIVIPYKYPISKEQHIKVATFLLYKLGAQNIGSDRISQRALSRPTYFPAVTSDRKKHFRCIPNNKKVFFDPKKATLSPEEQFEFDQLNDTSKEKEKFNPNESSSEGGRNDSIARLAGKFIQAGMDLPMAINSSFVWNTNNCEPPLPNEEVKTIVESVYGSHKRNHKDSGWGYDEILRRINQGANPEKDYDQHLMLVVNSQKKLSRSETERLVRKLAAKCKLPISTVKSEFKEKVDVKSDNTLIEEEEKSELTAESLREEFKDWIYLRRDDRIYNAKNGIVYKVEGFNRSFSGKVDKGSLLQILLKYNCIKQVDMLQFNPGRDKTYREDHISYGNTYIAPDVFPLPGSIKPMLRHFEYLFPLADERNIMLDYIAYLVQNPGKKVRWMPVIKGHKRIGKSIIVNDIMLPILGYQNVTPVDSNIVRSDFNSWQLDTQLVVFHELKIGETRREKLSLTESLKSFITDPWIMAHRKGLDPYRVFNRANVIGLTNHEDAIMITPDEQRFAMIRTEAKPKSASYYERLCRWCDVHREEMLFYFEERDISKFNPSTAPYTKFSEEVKESSLMWPSSILITAMKDPKHFFNTTGYFSWERIVRFVQDESSGKDLLVAHNLESAGSSQSYLLSNAMKEIGFRKWSHPVHKSQSRVYARGKQMPVWVSPKYVTKRRPAPHVVKHMIDNEPITNDFDGEE